MSSNGVLRKNKSTSDISKLKKKYFYDFFQKKDLKVINQDGFILYVIPKEYYLWRGIKIDISKAEWDESVVNDKNKVFITQSSFFADKKIASLYGTKTKNPKMTGIDLQFYIQEDIKLLDISDIRNIKRLWNHFKKIQIENVDDYPYLSEIYKKEHIKWMKSEIQKKKYPTEKDFFEKFKNDYVYEIIVQTIGNLEYDSNKQIKTPTKCKRCSVDYMDLELVDVICKLLNCEIDGWIYFKQEDNDFHDEILLCNAPQFLKYVGSHKI